MQNLADKAKCEAPTVDIEVNIVEDKQPEEKYSSRKKWIIFTVIVLAQIMNRMSVSALYPALPEIRDALHTTETVTNATAAAYAVIAGIFSSFWATCSNIYGRRPIYIISITIATLGNVGSALSINIEMLIVFRAVVGFGGCACLPLSSGVLTEVFNEYEHGKALSWNSAIPTCFTIIAPILGGLLTQYFGWRGVFWAYAICYGIIVALLLAFLPETNRLASPPKSGQRFFNPFKSLILMKYPNLLLTSLYIGIIVYVTFASNISFTWAYSNQYNFDSTTVGICYIPLAFGCCMGAYVAGLLSDRMYKRRKQRATTMHQRVPPEMRLSMTVLGPSVVLMAGGYAAYGWLISEDLHFAYGIVAQTIAQFGTIIWTCFLTVYAMQCFPGQGASVQACFQIVRGVFIPGATLSVIELEKSLGHEIVFTGCGGILFIASFYVIYIQRRSEKWEKMRMRSNDCVTSTSSSRLPKKNTVNRPTKNDHRCLMRIPCLPSDF
ncbi:major facilitator superfamily domain-containing protein [Fennellomyces sp. T-0311]|nr:major facilitator superfamily domain-containing protein [Fennellomyces sp. T-0311]